MSYTALYRKYRPQRFEDVRGQDPIVNTLKNQITHDRIGHAYLFAGTRGTGKTTVAKIFARAVNCEHPVNGSPCNECPTCRAILNGSSVNVVEIDAASNNGVDNIREIREEVKYKPTEGKYRVYIVDEVHMLSAGAFNALLKTLEEPPEYVIFILATTEVHKIPVTILSRCQRYDFRRLPLETLKDQLSGVLQAEGIEAEEDAVSYLAARADGSSRDGLSLLEQCVSLRPDRRLTYENVLDALGAVDQRVFSAMTGQILSQNLSGAIQETDKLLSMGRDLSQFVTDYIWYFRNLMLLSTGDPGENILGISRENMARMREEAKDLSLDEIIRFIRILSELSNALRASGSRRVLFETALLRMMRPETEEDYESLIQRVRFLEDRVSAIQKDGVVISTNAAAGIPGAVGSPAVSRIDAQADTKEVTVPPAVYEDYEKLTKDWQDICLGLRGALRSSITKATVSADESGRLILYFPSQFALDSAVRMEGEEELKKILTKRYGREFKLNFKALRTGENAPRVAKNRIPGIEMEIDSSV
ncbi:MAG: DNA polymerase III subunit gamma/tau [Lachnospiraceae bacterium]|nr:DNA polymerase III subunit gamma/tau [Lachnospiraceae bacterium]